MRRKKFDEDNESPDRWMVSYADFITLMFAFFTVMYATSTKDFDKEKKFEESVKKAFLTAARFGQGSGPEDFPKPGEDTSIFPPLLELFQRRNASPMELLNAVEHVVNKDISKEDQKSLGLEVVEDTQGVRIRMDSSSIFDSGSSKMKRETFAALSKVAQILKETGRNLLVEGHTDNQAIQTSQYPSNWELAAARASTVVRFLIKVHEINPAKLAAISYADQHPIASNADEQGRAKNRRIEVLITTSTK